MCHSIESTRCRLMNVNANVITSCILVCLQQTFHKCSLYLDTLILKILYKLTKNFLSYEVWWQTVFLGLGYKTFSKTLGANSSLVTHVNIFVLNWLH